MRNDSPMVAVCAFTRVNDPEPNWKCLDIEVIKHGLGCFVAKYHSSLSTQVFFFP